MTVSCASRHGLPSRLEAWGGVECTVNRIGDTWQDQIARSGHDWRGDDLMRFAELGIQAIRYPVLWERTASADSNRWQWLDERLVTLRELGIRPIAGLVHHGSGPAGTSLLDEKFAVGLQQYAGEVAARYPWLSAYTPINEPLTTARFSGLYGHWYPHAQSDRAFVRALLNQCRGVILAMQAIRKVNSDAQLIQTEDLGKTHSTPALAGQAEFENHRRWLSLDLLTGRVSPNHELWNYLLDSGASQPELHWFEDHACPPDVLGFNNYLTSERYLDERLERYPAHTHGSNGRQVYADVEAVRVCDDAEIGLEVLLREAWRRYQLPLAITEVHLGCRRESQLRWLLDAWKTATNLRASGVDVRAVTAWSLLGSFDWNSLCTRDEGYYEPGVFDLRGGTPRPTVLATALKSLSRGVELQHPALPAQGWWRRDSRFLYSLDSTGRTGPCGVADASVSQQPLLIVGATGTVGQAIVQACRERGLTYIALGRSDLDIADRASIDRTLARYRPWAVVNAAGYQQVDEAESNAAVCRLVNTVGPIDLAQACAQRDIALVMFSSDLVFDGRGQSPYIESDNTAPLCIYGQTKAEAEQGVLAAHPEALVVRTSHLFSPFGGNGFLPSVLQHVAKGMRVSVPDNWIMSPTYAPDLVHACIDLMIDGEKGIWHLANQGHITWADFARQGAERLCFDQRLIHGCAGEEMKYAAARPRYSALGSQRGLLLPPLADGLRRYCEVVRATHPAGFPAMTSAGSAS